MGCVIGIILKIVKDKDRGNDQKFNNNDSNAKGNVNDGKENIGNLVSLSNIDLINLYKYC